MGEISAYNTVHVVVMPHDKNLLKLQSHNNLKKCVGYVGLASAGESFTRDGDIVEKEEEKDI